MRLFSAVWQNPLAHLARVSFVDNVCSYNFCNTLACRRRRWASAPLHAKATRKTIRTEEKMVREDVHVYIPWFSLVEKQLALSCMMSIAKDILRALAAFESRHCRWPRGLSMGHWRWDYEAYSKEDWKPTTLPWPTPVLPSWGSLTARLHSDDIRAFDLELAPAGYVAWKLFLYIRMNMGVLGSKCCTTYFWYDFIFDRICLDVQYPDTLCLIRMGIPISEKFADMYIKKLIR